MFSEMKKEIIEAGILLDRYELVSLTCGNLSVRMPTGEILVTPSGMMYEKMVEDDMIVMDIDGNVIEGTRKPSSDTPAILHIFRERPDINAVIHTHQPYATAVSAHSRPDRVPRMYYRTGQCRRRQRADHTLFGCRLDRYGHRYG